MLHQAKTLHLVEEVGMDEGKGWVQTVGGGSSHLVWGSHLENFRKEGMHLG